MQQADENQQPSTPAVELTTEEKDLEDTTPTTEIVMHRGSQTTTFDPDFLFLIFPDKLNQYTIDDGVVFKFHFLSQSLHFWVEIENTKPPKDTKLSKKDASFIRQQLRIEDNEVYTRWEPHLENSKDWKVKEAVEASFVAPGSSLRFVEKAGKKFEIAYARGDDPELMSYRERFELFLLMFVDGASCVTTADGTWGYYLVYEIDSEGRRHFAGLMSKYEFKITAKRVRQRISQALILPCYQKMGLGKELLDEFYAQALKQEECFEITVEGPSFEFQCLRDFKELESIITGGIYKDLPLYDLPLKTVQDLSKLKSLHTSKEKIRELKAKLKLPGHQIERLVDILIYSRVLSSTEELIRSIFEDQQRKKILIEQSAFRNRKNKPSLFVEGQSINISDYLMVKTKEDFILKSSGEIEQILTQNLNGYRRVIDKLKREGRLTNETLTKAKGSPNKGEKTLNKEEGGLSQ